MTAANLTLADFLLARIAEDEAEARKGKADSYSIEGGGITYAETGYNTLPDLTIDPDRVLAECGAKRVAVDWYLNDDATVMEATIRALAAVYANHPEYRDGWRP